MSARRIARELAVILLPQLPKETTKLEKLDHDKLVGKAVQMLTDYAKQCLADANGFVVKAQQKLIDLEIDSPVNADREDLKSITLTTAQVQEQLDLMERALHLTSEALDIPQIKVESKDTEFLYRLVSSYFENRRQIDETINRVRESWKVERMVSIDRDIIRLACAEAFYMTDIPIKVAINEAVELSHRFADDRAAKFINGILADVAKEAEHFRSTGEYRTEESMEQHS